jgi:hypothetical protein
MLRRLTGLGTSRRIDDGGLLGEHKSFLDDQLAELSTLNSVRAAAFLGQNALVVAGADRSDEVSTLASVFSVISSLKIGGRHARRVVWSDTRGSRFEFHRVVPSDSRPLYLGIWSQSVRPPESTVARIRYACSGLRSVKEDDERVEPVALSSGIERELFSPMTDVSGVASIGLLSGQGTVAHVESDDATSYRDDVAVVLRQISRLGAHLPDVSEDTEQLLVETRGGRVVGFHPLETSDGRVALLYMEVGGDQPYPEDRMSKWKGHLAWRLPKIEDARISSEGNDDARAAGGTR